MGASNELFMAILSMDSYNRGYNAGLIDKALGEGVDTAKIGDATIFRNLSSVSQTFQQEAQAAGFYAIAYNWNGQTVISYRGTDGLFSAPWSDDPGSDVWNGYLQGGGLAIANQSKLAAKFFQSVTGTSNSDPSQGNAIVTGHSLGGGLAGFVASIYGQQGYLFDNMAFELAAGAAARGASNPDNAIPYNSMYFNGFGPTGFLIGENLHAYATTGEFLWANRVFQKTKVTAIDSNGGLRWTVDLHSQALLVNLLFAKENNLTDWSSVGKPLLDALFNPDVGAAAGFSAGSAQTGHYDPQYKMLAAIGYSALDGGAGNTNYGYVFGNTAIRAMFDDADELGSIVTAGKTSEALRFGVGGLTQTIVQFAGLMALNKVNYHDYESDSSQFHPRDGILKLSKADGSQTSAASDAVLLELSLNQDLWKLGQQSDAPDVEILGVETLLESIFNKAYGDSGSANLSVMYHAFDELYGEGEDATSLTKTVGSVQFSLASGPLKQSLAVSDTAYDQSHVSVFAATDKDDTINGNKQNNFIAGAAGDDVLYGRLGKDILLGGSGSDTFVDSVTEKDATDGRQNENDVYVGSNHYDGLLANFINWWLHPNETDVVRYTVEDFSTDDPMTTAHESTEQGEGIRVSEIKVDSDYGGAEAIMVTTEDLRSGAKGTDALIGIEKIELSDRPDELLITEDALKAAIVIDMGASGRLQSDLRDGETLSDDAFLTKVDVADYSAVGHGLIYLNGQTHYHHEVSANNVASMFSFAEQMEAIVSYVAKDVGLPNSNDGLRIKGADKIKLTDHDDVIINADYGSLVETGDGHDNVWIMDGVGITDLSKDDRVTLAGVLELHGGLKSAGSESPWAYGAYGTVYGLNDVGELQIKNIFWNVSHKNADGTTSYRPATLYILNWAESYKERVDGAGGIGAGNIYLAEYSISSSRLADLTADSRRSASVMGEGLYTILAMALKTMDPKTGFGGEDPLVLDLDGDGIELTKYDATKSRIDTDGDLYAEKTAFAAKDDGVLARDLNGNGKIDGASELFGHSGASGFSDLAKLDGNHDGVISAADNGLADFNGDGVINANDTIASLLVWQDKNENNVTDVGELSTLASRGIVSITLPTTTIDATAGTLNNGNRVGTVSSYTLSDGTTRDIADVALRVNNQLTTYVGPAISVSASVADLADLKGFGTLVSLHQAMSVSSASETAVRAAVTSFSTPDLGALREALRPILIAWAEGSPVGIDGVVTTGILNTRSYDDLAYVRTSDNKVVDYVWGYSGERGNFETFADDDHPKAEFAFASGVLATVNGGGTIKGRADLVALIADMTAANHLAANGGDVSVTVGTTTNDQMHTASYVQFARGSQTLRIYHYDDADWSRSLAQSVDHSIAAGQSFATVKGQDIAFYDRLIGESLKAFYVNPASATGGYNAVSTLLDKMEDTLNLFAVRVAVQNGPLSHYFESIKYDVGQDGFVSTDGHQLASVFSSLLVDAEATSNPTAWLAAWKPFFDVFIADYHRGNIYQTNNYPFLLQQMQNAVEQHPGGISVLDYAQAFSIPFDAIVSGSGSLNGSNNTDILIIDGDETYAAGSGGADNYIIGRDFQSMEIFDQDEGLSHYIDTIRFSSHNVADIEATRVGEDLFLTDKVTGQTIKVTNEFEGRWPGPGIDDASFDYGINQIIFEDGTTWSDVEIAEAVSRIDNNSTTVLGSAATDVLQGGKGDDILKGGGDTDVYRFSFGDGHDTINDLEDNTYRNDMDMLQFINGIRLNDLSFERVGESSDVTIHFKEHDGDSITIEAQFDATYTGVLGNMYQNRIELFTFDDGTSFSYDRLAQMVLDTYSTDGNDTLYGMNRQDVLQAGKGDDFVSGGNEDDTYIFNLGDGHDIFQDRTTNILSGMDNDVLKFGSGIKASNIVLSRDPGNADSIVLTIAATGDSVTLQNEYDYASGLGDYFFDRIEFIKFSDQPETTWTWSQIAAWELASQATTGNDRILGFSINDVLTGGAGDDYLSGRNGDDTYLWGAGFGNDTIEEQNLGALSGGGADKVVFEGNVTASDIFVSRGAGVFDLVITLKATGETLTLINQTDYNGTGYRPDQVDFFNFSDGSQWTAANLRQAYLIDAKTDGNDTITGFFSADTLAGGKGDDILDGGDGSDTYLFNVGDGHDTIRESWSNILYGEDDRVLFGAGFELDDAIFTRNGFDVLISFHNFTDTLLLADEFYVDYFDRHDVEIIQFSDGSVVTKAQIKDIFLTSTSADETIRGFDGSDTYYYSRGGGNDTIIDGMMSGGNDRLVLRDINPNDVKLVRNGDDVKLVIAESSPGAGDGGSVNLIGSFFHDYGTGVDVVVFADGTEWKPSMMRDMMFTGTSADEAFYGTGADDTFTYGRGGGNDSISDGMMNGYDTLSLINIGPGDVLIGVDGEDFVLKFRGANNVVDGSVRLVGSVYNDYSTGVERVLFENGTQWDVPTMRRLYVSQAETSGNDIVYGLKNSDTFEAGKGDDTIMGGAGDDTYIYARGDGNDRIVELADQGMSDKVVFKNINASDVRLIQSEVGLKIVIKESSPNAGDGGSITAETWNTAKGEGIEKIVFADGTQWDSSRIKSLVLQTAQTEGDDRIFGFDTNEDIVAGHGNDFMNGGAGNDTYHYARGDGNDIILETANSGTADRIVFSDITASAVTLSHLGLDIILSIAASGSGANDAGSITLKSVLGGTDGTGVENVVFADGTIWTSSYMIAAVTDHEGTPADDFITGTSGVEVVTGGRGDDVMNGLGGNDTYVYSRGDGNDVIIEDQWNGTDKLIFTDINVSDISVSYSGTDLRVVIAESTPGAGDGGSLLIKGTLGGTFGQGIESVVFADGTTATAAMINAFAVASAQTAGNDTITAFNGSDDTIAGGRGDDVMNGLGGNDTYVYSRGDGNDVIIEDQWNGTDKLIFTDINVSDISVSYSGTDLRVVIAESTPGAGDGGSLLIKGTLGGTFGQGIESVVFADGTTATAAMINAFAVASAQTAGNDTITAFNGSNDTITGGHGNDTMNGLGGDDTYVYARGDGNDVIIEDQWNGADKLVFTDINVSNISVSYSGTDLTVIIAESAPGAGDGGAIELIGTLGGTFGQGLENIVFADGTTWDAATINAKAITSSQTAGNDTITGFSGSDDIIVGGRGDDVMNGLGGNDTYVYSRGDGNDVIIEDQWNGTDKLIFTDINVSDISVSYSGTDLRVVIAESTPGAGDGGSLLIKGTLGGTFGQGIESVVFADGTTATAAMINAFAVASAQTAGNDTITAFNGSDDTIAGGRGDDVMNGLGGNDTYVYSRGDGNDVIIEDQWNGTDKLIFTDIKTGEVNLVRNGNDLILQIAASSPGAADSGSVKLVGEILTSFGQGVDSILFADGITWTNGDLLRKVVSQAGTSGNDSINGTSSADTIAGGRGNDTMNGLGGNDTYLYSRGDGDDKITEDSWNGTDKLVFTDIDAANVRLSYSGSDLTIKIMESSSGAADGGSVKLVGTLTDYFSQGVETVVFADGTTWDAAALRALALASAQTAGNDTITGFNTADTIAGGRGNDTMNGLGGNDTYLYSRGDGDDKITEDSWNGTDKLVFTDIDAANVRLSYSGSDLTIKIMESSSGAADGGSVKLVGTLTDYFSQGVETVVFTDGTTWDAAALRALALASAQTAGNDTITGFNTADTIAGGRGNDTMNGLGGNDTYLYSRGDGDDKITEDSWNGTDKLVFTDIDAANVRLSYSGSDLTIKIMESSSGAADGGSVKLVGTLTDYFSQGVETVVFADGTTWDAAALRALALASAQTAGNDTITGFNTADTIAGGRGNDTMNGLGGNDTYLYSRGDGDDKITEDSWNGTDKLVFTDIDAANVRLSYSGSDLTIKIMESSSGAADGGSVKLVGTLTDYFSQGVETVVFADGTTWDAAALRALALASAQTAGNDTITGFNTADTIAGGAGNDILTGGAGNDTFVFHSSFGQDTITDFTAGAGSVDVIQIDTNVFADFAAVMNAATQVGADTLITADASNVITLKNVTLSSLHQDDFSFAVAS